MIRKLPLSRRVLFTIFTISGFSGLIYESIWSHYLKLFLGHAAYAQTLVLAIFMGGMAFGAWFVARATTNVRNLLVSYAIVELVVGIIALLFHKLYIGATGFAFDSVIPGLESAGTISFFKWTLGALLILPQSILLGTTFPLISGGVIRRFPERSGETLAMLYFTNSLGAALGVLASGFLLIEKVGLPGTVMTAGLLNVLLALFVWVLARDGEPAAPPAQPERARAASMVTRWICIAAFLAGLAAFVYEIAWIRMLSLVLGSSTHAFELMLSAFILGLALGGLWVRRRIDTIVHARRALATMFALMAVFAVLTLPAYGFAFDVMASALKMFGTTPQGYTGFNLVSHAIAAAMMLPTTIIAGMTLPLMTNYLLREGAGEQAIGKVYAANTVGAIAGVLIAIHLLLPIVGTKGAVLIGGLFQIAVAVILLRGEGAAVSRKLAHGALAASLLVLLVVSVGVRLDPLRMASGVYRRGSATLPEDVKVMFLRDGKTAMISLIQQGTIVAIATNGKSDAAINMGPGIAGADEITMTLAAALPLAMHPNPRRIANIGVGSGLTSHVVLTAPNVEVLDSVEIEPVMVQAARIGFGPRVRNLFDDPRSHIHYEDAKTFFATAKQPYDVIISEPSNPWVSGVATLFSSEFYAHIKRYLGKQGLLVQWVQIYETDVRIVASILKALGPHFADYAIYSTDDANMLIVASVEGPLPPLRADAIADSALATELRKVGVESLTDINIRRIGSKALLGPLFASYPAPPNSDYFPYVDLNAPRMRFLHASALELSTMSLYPVPALELLGEPAVPTTRRAQPEITFTERQRQTERAMNVRDALASGDARNLAIDGTRDFLALHASAASCTERGILNTWMHTVGSIAAQTTPYLSGPETRPVWEAVRASPCMKAAGEPERLWVDFLDAVAARDAAHIQLKGKEILAAPGEIAAERRVEVLLAVSSAQLGSGQLDAAVELLRANIALVESQRSQNLPMRLVESVAIARLRDKRAGR